MFNAARRERTPRTRSRLLTQMIGAAVSPGRCNCGYYRNIASFPSAFVVSCIILVKFFVWRLVSSRFHRAPFVADEMVVSGADSGGVETPEGASSAPGEPPAWPSAADNR